MLSLNSSKKQMKQFTIRQKTRICSFVFWKNCRLEKTITICQTFSFIENTPDSPKFIHPLCPIDPKFWIIVVKKASLDIYSSCTVQSHPMKEEKFKNKVRHFLLGFWTWLYLHCIDWSEIEHWQLYKCLKECNPELMFLVAHSQAVQLMHLVFPPLLSFCRTGFFCLCSLQSHT